MNVLNHGEFGDTRRCPGCGKMRLTSVAGLCPACLLRLGLDDSSRPDTAPDLIGAGEHVTPPPMTEWLRIKSERIGNYDLLDEIARGGMGIVYRARQSQPARVVALKMMLPFLATSERMRERFRIESDAVARLDHPGILPIYDVGEHDGMPYFSMKFAEGGCLAQRMPSLRDQWRQISEIVCKLARAVQHAHDSGILHRDLKPGNVLFDARGEPMIADFGLAKFRAVNQNMTLPSAVLGSPNYIAPEQISPDLGDIGPAADIYSLGAILYELLTDKPPILGQDAGATLRMVLVAVPESGARTNPQIPPELDSIALKCLEKVPEHRYASAAALADDLDCWLQGRPLARDLRRRGKNHAEMAARLLLVAFLTSLLAHDVRFERAAEPAMPSSETHVSVAVLPFVDMSENKDQEFLSDGLSEELINMLTRVPNLRVPARTSSFYFKGKQSTIDEIARALGVTHVVEGSVRRYGDKVRIAAQLIRADDANHVWSATFERPIDDIFKVQDEVTAAVVKGVKVSLLDGELRNPAHTVRLEAYSLYLQGRFLARRRGAGDFAPAIAYLQKALSMDPEFAPGWAQLALTRLDFFRTLVIGSADEVRKKSLDAADRALALDQRLADAHLAMGSILSTIDWDWNAAAIEFGKALQTDPDNTGALMALARIAAITGRPEEALRLSRRVVALDPLNHQAYNLLAMALNHMGRYAQGEDASRKVLELNPTGATNHYWIGYELLAQGEPAAALAEFELEADTSIRNDGRMLALDGLGRVREAQAVADELAKADPMGAAANLAAFYACRKHRDLAFFWLDRALQVRDAYITEIKGDYCFDNLKQDPRYPILLRKMNLSNPS